MTNQDANTIVEKSREEYLDEMVREWQQTARNNNPLGLVVSLLTNAQDALSFGLKDAAVETIYDALYLSDMVHDTVAGSIVSDELLWLHNNLRYGKRNNCSWANAYLNDLKFYILNTI